MALPKAYGLGIFDALGRVLRPDAGLTISARVAVKGTGGLGATTHSLPWKNTGCVGNNPRITRAVTLFLNTSTRRSKA